MQPSAPPLGAVTRVVLSNGLTVLVREDHAAPVAAVVTYVKVGYFDEPDDVGGIAHVLEHMYFKGTPTRGVGEIAKQTKASGGYLNAATIYDYTTYYAVLPSAGFRAGLEVQADAYANCLLDGEELRRELEVIIEEAKRKRDNPGAVATETLFELMHDRHRIRRWRIGHEPALRGLRHQHLHAFYRNHYRPSNTIVAIVGDVDTNETLGVVQGLYGGLADGPIQRVPGDQELEPSGRRYRELTGDIAHTHVAFGWRTPGTRDPDTVHLDLLATVLGSGRASRLYRAVRERRLASAATAYNYTPTALGVFVVHAQGERATSHEAAAAVWQEVAHVRAGVARVDLQRAQQLFEARLLRRLETMDGQANYLAECEALGGWHLGAEYADQVRSATTDQLRSAAQRHLDPGNVSVLVYRPSHAAAFAGGAADAFAIIESGARSVEALGAVELAVVAPLRAGPTVRLEEQLGEVSVFRTVAGLPILIRRRPGAPIVHLGCYSRPGASGERSDESGISTLMARCMVKGTTSRSADRLALECELLGGSVSPSVTADGAGWTLSVPTTQFSAAATLLADIVQRPAFDAAVLQTERLHMKAAIEELRDDMYRFPARLASEAAYGDHPYGRSVLGRPDTLDAATVQSVRDWHSSAVLLGDCVVALVGDVDPQEAANLLGAAFDAVAPRASAAIKPPTWPAQPVQRIEGRDKLQSAMFMAFPGPTRTDPARFAGQLLVGITSGLGGRFFDELRDKQSLAYTVHTSQNDRVLAGTFAAYIASSPEKEEAARAGLLHEVERLRSAGVTADELHRARTYAVGTWAISQQSAGNLLAELVDAWLYGDGVQEIGRYEAALHAVSAADILDYAVRFLNPSTRVEGVVRANGAPAPDILTSR